MRDLLKTAFETVVMVSDHSSLFDSAERLEPSLAVVDLALTDGGGLELVTRCHEQFPDLRLIVLGVHGTSSVARSVLEAGASAYVLKQTIAADLLEAVDSVLSAATYTSPSIEAATPSDVHSPPGGN